MQRKPHMTSSIMRRQNTLQSKEISTKFNSTPTALQTYGYNAQGEKLLKGLHGKQKGTEGTDEAQKKITKRKRKFIIE